MRPTTEQQARMVREGRADELLQLADRVAAMDADSSWPFHTRATVYHLLGRHEDAIANVQSLLDREGDDTPDPRWHYWLGELYRTVGDFVRAIDHYSAVVRNGDQYFVEEALFYRAECYLSLQEFERAIADCESISPGFLLFERTPAMVLADARRGLRLRKT